MVRVSCTSTKLDVKETKAGLDAAKIKSVDD